MSEDYCEFHSDKARLYGDRNRKLLDPIMARLPKSQAGAGTHRCAYCAYERGYEDAKREMQTALEKLSPPRPARETSPKVEDFPDLSTFQLEE